MSAKSEALRLAEILENGSRQFNAEAAAELRRLSAVEAQWDALLEALKLIADTNPVDAALDLQRAVRVANVAIKQAEGENT